MGPLDRIEELIAYVEAAKAVPMSRACRVDRGELIAMLEELQAELPADIRRSEVMLAERDKIISAGEKEAERIIAEGEGEHARLVSQHEITVSAEHEASRIIGEAREEAQRLRDEVDEYVDTTLANFEQFLQRAVSGVERGRDKMHALREIGTFNPPEQEESEEKPLPQF
ncbi:SPFH domain-containing protein [Salininema proteolyticum]|uniref:ATPase n=1 Tax=Salininema proteolyticum TaxID=1607685 RepID=A0ABV8TXX2_9ACTN